MPKGPQQPLRAEGNSSWLEKCRERDRKKTEISLFRWNPLLYPLMVCPTMISSLLHKRAWRLVPQGGGTKEPVCDYAHAQDCVCLCAMLDNSECCVRLGYFSRSPALHIHSQLAWNSCWATLYHTLQHQSLLQVALCSSGLWMIWRAKWPSLPPVITVCCQWLRPDWVQGASEVMKPPLYKETTTGGGEKKNMECCF